MKANQVKNLLEQYINLEKKQSEYLEKIPSDIKEAFFDNTYTTLQGQQIDLLREFIFGTWDEDVTYFLYEPYPHVITTKIKEYTINNLDEYIEYMVSEGFVEK